MKQKLVSIYANILHIRFSDTFSALPPATLNSISPNNLFYRILRVLFLAGRHVLNFFLPLKNKNKIRGKIWLYVVSKNNYEALQFIKATVPESVFVAGQNKDISRYNQQVNRLSTRYKLFYLYKFLVLLPGLYKLKGRRATRFFDLIFQATGYYELSLGYLQKYKPKAIIFANDHNTDPRALLLAAKNLNISTIYIQHASVSTSFPPLQFDLNLLEGQDSLDKYQQCGPISGAVKLIGMPKADSYIRNKNLKTTIEAIGVTANIIDDVAGIREVLENLSMQFPQTQITFRPHPGDRRGFSFIQLYPNIIFSDSRQETVFDFLQKQDAIIAADSSVHLEATMLNILSIYHRFGQSDFIDDYYGYVRHHLIERTDSLPGLINILMQYKNQRPLVYERARYYNAVLGTEFEGRSHELAMQHINNFLASAAVPGA